MPELILEAGRTGQQYWRDLWRYRELFYVLAWRDFSVRYKQTSIGILWAFLQPFLTSVVFTLLFGRLNHLDAFQGAPYFLVVFAAMMPWQFFANSLSGASQCLINNANLISKVYFPRLIVPASAIVTYLADLFITFLLLAGVMIWYQFLPSWRLLFLPGFVLIAFASALGPGLFLTALTVQYRDFRYVVPFIVQIGFFISPVGYSTSRIPEAWRLVYSLNPMVGAIDGFRWSILGGESVIYWPGFFLSLVVAAIILWLGISYFRRMERSFADVI